MPEQEAGRSPKISWDVGTAYDFFASLFVIHSPADFGLRAPWAAGIRSRLSLESRDLFSLTAFHMNIPTPWLLNLPKPKYARTVLDALEALKPEEILPALSSNPENREPCEEVVRRVLAKGSRNDADVKQYQSCIGPAHQKTPMYGTDSIGKWLDCWVRPDRFGESYRRGLREYYEVFFREEERRILPDVERALAQAQELAATRPGGRAVREGIPGHPGRVPPEAVRARARALLVVFPADPLHGHCARPAGGAVRCAARRCLAGARGLGAGRAAARARGALRPHAAGDPARRSPRRRCPRRTSRAACGSGRRPSATISRACASRGSSRTSARRRARRATACASRRSARPAAS